MDTVKFETKVLKQAMVEWLLKKIPFDILLENSFREFRVGSQQREKISSFAYQFIDEWPQWTPHKLSDESIKDLQKLLEESFRKNKVALKDHEKLSPKFNLKALEHLKSKHRIPDILLEDKRLDEWHSFLHSMKKEAPFFIRRNKSKISHDELLKKLEHRKIENSHWLEQTSYTFAQRWPLNQDPTFLAGCYEVQDEHSQLIGLLSNVQNGQKVLDICAGAGGKTLHMAEMAPQAEIWAYDIDKKKLGELQNRAKRHQIKNIKICHEVPLKNQFDFILIDAPCSSLGTLRRQKDLFYRWESVRLHEILKTQRDLLDLCEKMLAKNGALMYVTCTTFQEENKKQIAQFLQRHPQRECISLDNILRKIMADKYVDFLTAYKKTPTYVLQSESPDSNNEPFLTLGPSLLTERNSLTGDAFFVSLIK